MGFPTEFVPAGSSLDGQIVTINAAKFDVYDFNGKAPDTVVLSLSCVIEESGREQTQYFSLGGTTERFEITDDGEGIEVVSGRGISDACNYSHFITSLIEAGFDTANLSKASDLEGMRLLLEDSVVANQRPREGEKPRTAIAVAKILGDDEDGKSSNSNKKPSKNTSNTDAMKKIAEAIAEILGEEESPLKKNVARNRVLKELKGEVDKDIIISSFGDEEKLAIIAGFGEDNGFTFDGDKFELG